MENVRIFLFLFFLLFVGRGGKKKIKSLSTIPVVFKPMPVLNVHISYGPDADDDFLGGTGKSGPPSGAVGVLCCPPCGSELCRALPATLSPARPPLRTQEPADRPGAGKNAQKWDFVSSRGRPSRQPAALKDTALAAPCRTLPSVPRREGIFSDSEAKHFNFSNACPLLAWVLSWHNQAGAVGLSV